MNPEEIIDRLSSGGVIELMAVAIVALAGVVIILYRRNNALQDKLLEVMEKRGGENRDLLTETNKSINSSTEAIKQIIRLLETTVLSGGRKQ